MFYSHQLLARKAPLGQIWMAATLHAKINRKKLNKLNIIKICEEILNPTVPMALRLSGILMGGVVIVYERKVKILFEDVNRLLVEINEAWKTKAAPSDGSDPTRLPKNKCQAKHKAVTLPNSRVDDLGETEQSLPYSNGTTTFMGFQQTSYFAMRLDSVDDTGFNQTTQGARDNDPHQVDAANITLLDDYNPYQADTTAFNHFERFDIEGDEEFTPPEHTDIPSSLIPSPLPPEEPLKPASSSPIRQLPTTGTITQRTSCFAADEIQEQHPEEQVKQQFDKSKDPKQVQKMQRPVRRAKRKAALAMNDEYNVIPGQIYQTWLRDPSDLGSNRGRKRNMTQDPVSKLKIDIRLGLPSVVVFEKLFTSDMNIHYPEPLLKDWMKITQPPLDSPSGRTSAPQPPEPSSSSPPEVMRYMGPMPDPFEDFNTGLGPLPTKISIERQRTYDYNNEPPVIMEEFMNNLKPNGVSASKSNPMATPEYSGDGIRSVPSSGSGKSFSKIAEVNSGKKRPFSGSKNSGNGLEPVAEDLPWEHYNPKYKLSRLSEHELPPDDDLLVETGPTQTQKHPTTNHLPLDHITDAIKTHLKTHFDAPESANEESLINLARGMNKKRAACLFYQTCVLATRNYIKVEQKSPYGDILISRGANM